MDVLSCNSCLIRVVLCVWLKKPFFMLRVDDQLRGPLVGGSLVYHGTTVTFWTSVPTTAQHRLSALVYR
jgi:hypothetical protein